MGAPYTGVLHCLFTGDTVKAQSHVGVARSLIGDMCARLNTVSFVANTFRINGITYTIKINKGLPPKVVIYAPPDEHVVVEPKHVVGNLVWLPEGFFITPKHQDIARGGWGAPRISVGGEFINPPMGTPYAGIYLGAFKEVIINRFENNKYIDSLTPSILGDLGVLATHETVSAAISFQDYETVGVFSRPMLAEEDILTPQFPYVVVEDSEYPDITYNRFFEYVYEGKSEDWFVHWPEEIIKEDSFIEHSYRLVNSVRFSIGRAPVIRPVRGFDTDVSDSIVHQMVSSRQINHSSEDYDYEYRYFAQRLRIHGADFLSGADYTAGENLQIIQPLSWFYDEPAADAASFSITEYVLSPPHYFFMVHPWTDHDEGYVGTLQISVSPGMVSDDAGDPEAESTPCVYNSHIFNSQQYFAKHNSLTHDTGSLTAGIYVRRDQVISTYQLMPVDTFVSVAIVANRYVELPDAILGVGLYKPEESFDTWLVWATYDDSRNVFVLRGAKFGLRYSHTTNTILPDAVTTFAEIGIDEVVLTASKAMFHVDGSRCVFQCSFAAGIVTDYAVFNQHNLNHISSPSGGVPGGYEGIAIIELTTTGGRVVSKSTPKISVSASTTVLSNQPPVWQNTYSAVSNDVIHAYPVYVGTEVHFCELHSTIQYTADTTFENPNSRDFASTSTTLPITVHANDVSVFLEQKIVFPDSQTHVYRRHTGTGIQWDPGFYDILAYIDPLKPHDLCYVRVNYQQIPWPDQQFPGYYTIEGVHEVVFRGEAVYTSPSTPRMSGQTFDDFEIYTGAAIGLGLVSFSDYLGGYSLENWSDSRFYIIAPVTSAQLYRRDEPWQVGTQNWFCGDASTFKHPGDVPLQDYGYSFFTAGCRAGTTSFWRSQPFLPATGNSGLDVDSSVGLTRVHADVHTYDAEKIAAMRVVAVNAYREIGDQFVGVDNREEGIVPGKFFVQSSLDLSVLTGVDGISDDIWPFGRV